MRNFIMKEFGTILKDSFDTAGVLYDPERGEEFESV